MRVYVRNNLRSTELFLGKKYLKIIYKMTKSNENAKTAAL